MLPPSRKLSTISAALSQKILEHGQRRASRCRRIRRRGVCYTVWRLSTRPHDALRENDTLPKVSGDVGEVRASTVFQHLLLLASLSGAGDGRVQKPTVKTCVRVLVERTGRFLEGLLWMRKKSSTHQNQVSSSCCS